MDKTDDTEVQEQKRSARRWPTAASLDALPADIQAVVGRYPELEDLFVVPRIGYAYRIIAGVFSLFVLVLIGMILAGSSLQGKERVYAVVLGLLGALVVMLIGYFADRRRIPTRFLVIAVVCGVIATGVSAALLVPAGLAAVQQTERTWSQLDDGTRPVGPYSQRYGYEKLTRTDFLQGATTFFIVTFWLVTGGLLFLTFVRGGARARSDVQRWYWLRQAGLVDGPDQMDLPHIHHRCVAPWFVLPRIRGSYAYWAVCLPILLALCIAALNLVDYAHAVRTYRETMGVISQALAGYVGILLAFGVPGALLDLMRVKGRLAGGILFGLPVVSIGLVACLVWLSDSQDLEDGLIVTFGIGIGVQFLVLTAVVIFHLGRSVRVHFRRQQMLTDMMEDALNVDDVDPPPYGPIDPDDEVLGYQPFPTPPPGEGSDT